MRGMVVAFLAGVALGLLLVWGIVSLGPAPYHAARVSCPGSARALAKLHAAHADFGRQIEALQRELCQDSRALVRLPVAGTLRQHVFFVTLRESPPSKTSVPQLRASGSAQEWELQSAAAQSRHSACAECPAKNATSASVRDNAPVPTDAVRPESTPRATSTLDVSQKKAVRPAPDALYARALKLYESGQYVRSRERFAAFMQAFPGSLLLPNALYWTAETWYAQNRLDQALSAFAQVVKRYPRHAKSADALLKMAYCAMRRGDTGQAEKYLSQLERDFAGSRACVLGRQALRTLGGQSDSGVLVSARG